MTTKQPTRIVQLIDSLEPGGAERMAVSYANGLGNLVSFSGLVATRVEGDLKFKINNQGTYLFLKRKKTIDFSALFKFRKYLVQNKVDIVHAHSTSVFFAFLIKILLPRIQIIWHDHYGNSELLQIRKNKILKFISLFLFGIISVNRNLENWAKQNLYCKNLIYLPNFTTQENEEVVSKTKLKGIDGKRILCLANLRPQKNHQLLIEVAEELFKIHPDWTFHLVGKDFDDSYSKEIKAMISAKNLHDTVFLYGSKNDISSIISQSSIGVLTSISEGLPVALLEYGRGNLSVVCTDVGEVSTVINSDESGVLVKSNDAISFLKALIYLINNPTVRSSHGQKLFEESCNVYAEQPVLNKYLKWIYER
ncbi:glycosyltransferase [Flavobacterium ardleyense]|uniref:Glycosyltransferase n=1 Tax=Flavobacterium ardleyense TaxID=2038737 RepID=A0ABW5ZBA5_9FLAO